MKRKVWILLVAVLAVLGIGPAYQANVEHRTALGRQALAATGLEFLGFDAALARARSEHRPVLADFSAIWCPVCREMHRTLFTDAAVKAAIAQGYELARIDYEAPEAPAFMQRYDVHSFPTLLVIDGDGRLLRKLPTTLDPAAFVAALKAG